MKPVLIYILMVALSAGCKPKVLSGSELQNKLIETMSNHLHKTLNPAVSFTIKDIEYFPDADKKEYICQFHVTMSVKGRDTTGIVAAKISNDFNKVTRSR